MEQQSPLAGGGRCARTACATTPVNGYALLAKSEVDRRLSDNLVWQTASQAIALMIARSRGGKSGLAAAARLIGQGEVATCPTVTPAVDRIGM
jgi:hypothetical protein